MDRSSIRSFRAQEFAEHGLRELAKSRLDTTREIVFQPLGARFLDAREDVTKVAALFREDAFRASAGYFCRMDLHLDREVADRLSSIDPRAVESRIEDATRAILERELPRAQGVYLARFEPTARGDLEPVARVHLSCRRTDGAPVPMLTREEAHRLQENWSRGVERAFGIERPRTPQEREKSQDRGATLGPEWAALRQTLARAQARLFAVYSERLGGKASHKDLADALANARSARETLAGPGRQPVGMLDLDRRQVLDVIQIRIEGGSRYLSGTLEPQRCNIIETAASRTAGLPDGTPGHPAAVVWPAGPDLHAALYFNQRNHPTRTPDNLDPAQFRDALEARLAPEIRTVAIRLEPMATGRTDLMGRIHARLPERDVERQAETKQPAKPQAEAPQQGSIVVMVDQGRSQTESESRPLAQQQELADRAQPKERDWGNERVFAVRLRIPTGAEQLGRLGLSPDEVAHVIQRAVDRAYPFLSREGLRNNFICSTSDRVLDVRIVVPAKLGWTLAELRSPQFQQRFAAGFNQALAQIAPSRIGREKQPKLPGLERALGIAQAPLMLRQFEQEPERAAKHAIGAAFDKLTNVLPQPFRIMRELGRTLGRFGRTD